MFNKYKNVVLFIVTILLIFGAIIFYNQWTQNSITIIKIYGSNTIGAELAPNLAAEFLENEGAKNIETVTPKNSVLEKLVKGKLNGKEAIISMKAHGSNTAFKCLKNDECDIGTSSRKITSEENKELNNPKEEVLALDGIAVIVHKDNPVKKLSIQQVAKIFSGEIIYWSQIPDNNDNLKAINVYARDNNSGTYDFFKNTVIKKAKLIDNAKRYEDNRKLAEDVAKDINSIGFVPQNKIGDAKSVEIYEEDSTPLAPTENNIKTQSYLISRTLYLYIKNNSSNKYAKKFIDFSLSTSGQSIVKKTGFVSQEIVITPPHNGDNPEKIKIDSNSDYEKLRTVAKPLGLSIRFNPGSFNVDSKATRDIERLTQEIENSKKQKQGSNQEILLLGFTDETGNTEDNKRLSKQRAAQVASLLEKKGITPKFVYGVGEIGAIASNKTEQGKEMNRRVEVWIY